MITSHNLYMLTISATDFKAKCLQLMDTVNRTGETIQITKRGKVIAELRPPGSDQKIHSKAGYAKGEFDIIGDIMAPYDIEWEVLKDGD